MDIKRNGSQPSAKGPADWFTGTVRIDPLFQPNDARRAAAAAVTFEPGARTAWHTHPLGQTLIVTAGCGCAQREGGPIEEIRPGDVVCFAPGEKHWHGAAPTTAMTHIAIQESLDGKAVDWLEKVSDEQYNSKNKPTKHHSMNTYKTKAYSAASATALLASTQINRREPTASDVQIEILFCGVCHSDLHFARNEWNFTQYPAVPGHEIVGRVTAVGTGVKKFKVGDTVGVGCLVDSCRTCPDCRDGLEQFCTGMIMTYGSMDKHLNAPTLGGYAQSIVVTEDFVLRMPANLNLAAAAPLLCAGITTYSPLKHWKVGPGQKVGIVGLGGLGHMGVKFAKAFGAHVVLFTTSPSKVADGKRLGAHEVVISKDDAQMAAHANSFDFILDAVSATHDIATYLNLLKRDGNLTLVGAPEKPLPVAAFPLIFRRRSFSGSLIGGLPETQEMLDFCGQHNITCDIEMIRMDEINTAYERMLKSDVKYRFVIDMASFKS